MEKIRLGISSCLLGQKVRYDGGHRLDRFLTDTLGHYVEYVPVCPEVESGLGVPREPMRLIGNPESPRLVTVRTNRDHTARIIEWANKKIEEIEGENLCGFIFKARSPSCGRAGVRIYNERGVPEKKWVGISARVFMERFPLLPVEDEGRLHDPDIRENFIERMFTLRRFREKMKEGRGRRRLVDFHTRHKFLILAHSEKYERMMGKLVAGIAEMSPAESYNRYQDLLMQALKLKTTTKKNANVLLHMAGYFKKKLSADEKREIVESIDMYREGLLPLIVPVTLISHYVRMYDQSYLNEQFYLHPHPLELQLRNHV